MTRKYGKPIGRKFVGIDEVYIVNSEPVEDDPQGLVIRFSDDNKSASVFFKGQWHVFPVVESENGILEIAIPIAEVHEPEPEVSPPMVEGRLVFNIKNR